MTNTCWQKLQRDRYIEEDIILGFPQNTKAKEWVLSYEKYSKEHSNFIKKYEWLGTVGYSSKYIFTARYNGFLGGVVIMGEPNSPQFGEQEILIHRGACASLTPKNLGSRLIMFSCKWITLHTNKRIFTAYSDPEAGEIGTIYQACNFDYLGQSFGTDYKFKLINGKEVNSRYFTKTSTFKRYAKEINISWDKKWDKETGYMDLNKIPKDILEKLKNKGIEERNNSKKIKSTHKGKYVLMLNDKGKHVVSDLWIKLPYIKRTYPVK